VSVHIAGIVTC